MTYCIGLRTDRGVLIAADSAFSSQVASTLAKAGDATTFGERQGAVGPHHLRYVSEEGLKVGVGSETVVGFAGNVDAARTLIRAYFDGRASGMNAREAVRVALVSVTPCREEAEVLFAFYENGTPSLMLVNTLEASTRDVEGLIQLGSDLSARQHQWTARVVKSYMALLERVGPHPRHIDRIFTQLVALMQSYGTHDYLLPHGVGGAFVAAWVTAAGARWQGDHLYVIHGETPAFEDPMCATMVRENALCLINNQTDSTKVITLALPSESPSDTKARASAASVACTAAWDGGTFDYFISINSSKHVVIVVEMLGQQHHQLLSLHSTHIDNRLGIVWTQRLIISANTIAGEANPDPEHMSIWFFPFISIDTEMQLEREKFAWESFVEWDGEPGSIGVGR